MTANCCEIQAIQARQDSSHGLITCIGQLTPEMSDLKGKVGHIVMDHRFIF
jgi:hypothetical protein